MKLNEYFKWRNTISKENEIGIEVEMEGGYLPESVTGWQIKTDGSLRGNSFEYVFPAPTTREKSQVLIERLYTAFNSPSYKIKPSDRCGVHIHVNYRHETLETIFNAISLYFMLEDVLMHWCGEEREGNLFCLRAKDAEHILYALIKDKQQGGFDRVTSQNNFKYGALNLAALQAYGSLEYRGLQTPKITKPILTYLDIVTKIKDWAKTHSERETMDLFCHSGPLVFMRQVLGPTLARALRYEGWQRDMIEGVRRMQMLAYTPLHKMNTLDTASYSDTHEDLRNAEEEENDYFR